VLGDHTQLQMSGKHKTTFFVAFYIFLERHFLKEKKDNKKNVHFKFLFKVSKNLKFDAFLTILFFLNFGQDSNITLDLLIASLRKKKFIILAFHRKKTRLPRKKEVV
jgi:hypothetical protein